MRRREIIALFGGVALASRSAYATETFRLGILRPAASSELNTLASELRSLGYVEGANLTTVDGNTGADISRLPRLAIEIVEARPDVILAVSAAGVRAAKAATSTIPIVLFGNFDPVAEGFVATLARPGGNVTGVVIAPDGTLASKKVELLKEAVPTTRKMAFLAPPDENIARQLDEVKRAAQLLDIVVVVTVVHGRDYVHAFDVIAAQRPDVLFVAAHQYFVLDRRTIIDLSEVHRLPAIYEWPEQVADGGMMSYGTSLSYIYSRLAYYLHRIFRGAPPAKLPVEQPTRLELVLNLKTFARIGLTAPPTLLARADRVIE